VNLVPHFSPNNNNNNNNINNNNITITTTMAKGMTPFSQQQPVHHQVPILLTTEAEVLSIIAKVFLFKKKTSISLFSLFFFKKKYIYFFYFIVFYFIVFSFIVIV
jgi:hypothetical protein